MSVSSPTGSTLEAVSVVSRLPSRLHDLARIAYNFWWSWDHEAQGLFEEIDPELWRETRHNPVRVLYTADEQRLGELGDDGGYVSRVAGVARRFDAEMNGPAWYEGAADDSLRRDDHAFLAAYFCAEFGLAECFQIYSGGLGLLAGDHLKSASQLGIPLIALGLLYSHGYFHQRLDEDGMQREEYPELTPTRQPCRRVLDGSGEQLQVPVELPGRVVRCAVWRVDVGRVRLYLLDTNLPENEPADRQITANLYLGDQHRRIQQELVLGIGGVRALQAVGETPSVYHMNEGHAAFMALERIKDIRASTGATFDQAREAAAAAHVFTTHTPVPAGIDRFSPSLLKTYFSGYHEHLGLDMEGLLALGRENVADKGEAFSMAVLAIRCSRFCNGVSKLHGHVSRHMWKEIWPGTPEDEVPIGHVTNGVHHASWIDPGLGSVYDEHLGTRWRSEPQDPSSWEGATDIPDEKLWSHRNRRRGELVEYCRSRVAAQRAGGFDPTRADSNVLNHDALTIGFARRFAGYKRATLLLRDPHRLGRLLSSETPVQIVIAGKSHPGDGWGKDLIKQIVAFARTELANTRIVFLEDYDIEVARHMVQGVDVWLNNPIRGLEASGTSGMKAAMNGVLNASILDGWWDEAYDETLGYQIDALATYPNDAPNDERENYESNALYSLIENQLVPDFYHRNDRGIPLRWTARMKLCIKELAPRFCTHRMLQDYALGYYFPSHSAAAQLSRASFAPARGLADAIDRFRRHWPGVRSRSPIVEVGESGSLTIRAAVSLGTLKPDEVSVQVRTGRFKDHSEIVDAVVVPMDHLHDLGDGLHHFSVNLDHTVDTLDPNSAYQVRVLPNDERLVSRFIPGLIWSSPVHAIEPVQGS